MYCRMSLQKSARSAEISYVAICSVVPTICEAIIDSNSQWPATTVYNCRFLLAIPGASGSSIFVCILSFPSQTSSCLEAFQIVSVLTVFNDVCVQCTEWRLVRLIIFWNVHSRSSSGGMSTEMECVHQWSRENSKWGRREALGNGIDGHDHRSGDGWETIALLRAP